MSNYDTPKTLEKAIDYLYTGMTAKERRDFAWWGPVAFHSGLGRQIRNEWGLWGGSELKRHFNEVFGLGHADDMSGMILEGLEHRINGTEFDAKAKAETYQRYWIKMFIDPLSQEAIQF